MEDEKRLPPEKISDGCASAAGYEVVRSQFFSQSTEPALTFGRQKIWVNSVCLKKFAETDYVQILVNSSTKTLSLRPCREDARDALPWCSTSGGKRKPRRLSCPVFFAMICALMEWDSASRYRLAGRHLCGNGMELLAFDLQSAEAYAYGENQPRFPADWRDRFGTPATAHGVKPLVRFFDKYAVFELEAPAGKPKLPAVWKLEGEDEA